MTTDKTKFRFSYSLLDTWAKGRIDDCIRLYLHEPFFISDAVEEGKKIHKEVEETVKSTGQFPTWLTSIKLVKPKAEHKVIVPYNDLWDMSFVMDVLDEPIIHEFKTGETACTEWLSTYQLPFYFLGCELAGIEVDRAYLHRFNQHNREYEWGMVWNGRKQVEKARNFIDTIAPSVYDYFVEKGIVVSGGVQ